MLHEFSTWRDKKGISVLCAQEHNLSPAQQRDLERMATSKNMTVILSFAAVNQVGQHPGGVLLLLDNKTLSLKKVNHNLPGFLSANVEWGGTAIDVVGIYAPSTNAGTIREDFYKSLDGLIQPNSVVGGDFNCVPDVTLDVASQNPLAYPNKGAGALAEVLGKQSIVDERRNQLGNAPEPTRSQAGEGGRITATRLDRWYVPTAGPAKDMLWTYELHNTFTFKAVGSDHYGVVLYMEDQAGDLGHDRRTIQESIVLDRTVQGDILRVLAKAYEGNKCNANKWKDAMEGIKDLLMKETAKRRKKDKIEITRTLTSLQCIKRLIAFAPSERRLQYEKRLQRELYELRHPEMKDLPSDVSAFNMYERSEISSKAQFSTYKEQAKQQWVNEMKTATWEEGKDPVITGKTTNTKQVGNEFKKFYEMTFEEKQIKESRARPLLRELGKKKLFAESRNILDQDVTEKEVADVMENLPIGKQAGPNRIPNAVFKYLSRSFASKLADVINETTAKDALPAHFLDGDIAMLYKKGPRDDPRNYRPITLLNTDYKIFTRILARRMRDVVHQFVSECQKGFMPKTFIAEATMLLRLTEAYINEEPGSRQGILLFLDMEKAFDRVSYDFTLRGLEAVGFGPRFNKWVGLLYNVKKPPQRRIFVNGYYSDKFSIKSGVAQGCPLSPLLFLIVAEALRISMTLEKGIKGIKVGHHRYKISQFADDTTLLLRNKKEVTLADRALKRWCDATGMRENKLKREGLGMGRYKNKNLGMDIKWAKAGEWCVSLGVPIGNDFDEAKWWLKKVQATRNKAQQWVGLFRSSYAGRNMIVQSMYFGRLRYWLYSLGMPGQVSKIVQKDADILWWSREPAIHHTGGEELASLNDKRIRGWVRKPTALGPRNKGGLSKMVWEIHARNFRAQWVIRYLHPGYSSWKTIVDDWILFSKEGDERWPEGRSILASALTQSDRAKLLMGIPKKAKYLRQCIKDFWKIKLQPAATQENRKLIGSMNIWHNTYFTLDVDWRLKRYMKQELNVVLVSDIINEDTNLPLTLSDWKDYIREADTENGIPPDEQDVIDKGKEVRDAMRQVPRAVIRQLRVPFFTEPVEGDKVYIIRGTRDIPAIYQGNDRYEIIWIDTVGIGHATGKRTKRKNTDTIVEAVMWTHKKEKEEIWGPETDEPPDERWAGPITTCFPSNMEFKIGNDIDKIGSITIKSMTRDMTYPLMKPPPAQAVWEAKMGAIKWKKVWRIRSFFTTPRDQATWLKMLHRNLYVNQRDPDTDGKCNAHGCGQEESMSHLATCSKIRQGFWSKMETLVHKLGMKGGTTPRFWLFGARDDDTYVDDEEAGVIQLAWRCLYAETVHARKEKKILRMDAAYARTVLMIISRLKAQGQKWYRWYSKTRGISREKVKLFPIKYRNRKLLTTRADASYTINSTLLAEYESTKHNHLPRN